MGRAKLNMVLIRKEKSRHITFKKRKEGLLRKIHEFSTLCDVTTCMIIIGPKQENSPAEPEIWPQNPDVLSRIINVYKDKCKESATRISSVSDFFDDRKKRIEEERVKLRKKHREMTYPTWIDSMSYLPENKLRDFVTSLNNKLDFVKFRIESMKGNSHLPIQNTLLFLDGPSLSQQQQQMINFDANNASKLPCGLIQRNLEWEFMNQQATTISAAASPMEMLGVMNHYHHTTNIDQEHQVQEHDQMHGINPNLMTGMFMNDQNDHHHHMQFLGIASSCNIQTSFRREIFCGPTSGGDEVDINGGGGMIENGGYGHSRSLSCYTEPTMQPPMRPYTHCPTMSNAEQNLLLSRENEYNDLFHFQPNARN